MQMEPHAAVTLIMWLALGFTVLAMAIRWIRRTRASYGRWAFAGVLLVLSFFLLGWRSAPAWVNTVSADAGLALASILYLEGVREFQGMAARSWLAYAGGALAIGVVAFFLYSVPDMNARAVVMSLFLGIVLGLASITLLRRIPPAHRFGQTFTGAMFALCAATLLARALYCFLGPPLNDQNMGSGVYGAFVIATLLQMGGFSAGLALLADERVESDLSAIRERESHAGTEIARLIDAQAALRESEERFRFAQKAAGIGTFDWNIETGVNTWTPELEAMYGLPPGGFPRTHTAWQNLVHPDDWLKVSARMKESFATGAPIEAEWRVIWPDGSAHWMAGRWQVYRNGAGKPVRVTGVNIDITGRKEMEDSLRKSEERFRLAILATNDAIWDCDLQTGTVTWNETYSALYGRPPETSSSWQWWIDSIHPEDRERTASGLRAAVDGEATSWASEYRFRRVDGQWAYIYDRAYIARDPSGAAWRVIGAMQDLSERKRADAALRESEERFRRVFEEGPLGLALVGKDYRFLKVNSEFCQMTGYPEEELVQKTFADITHPEDIPASVAITQRLFQRNIPLFRMQKRYVKKNGEIIWGNLTASLVADRSGGFQYALAMIEDITEMKRMQAEALARQKLESVGTLASGIAHDFNNLLGSVEAQAELALAEVDEGSSCKEELNAICAVARRGSEIVRQLMIYAGIESELAERVDLSKVVEEMLALLKVSISKHAVINAGLDQDLPATRANAAQIRQIVMNLVTNASDAIGERDGVIRVVTKRGTAFEAPAASASLADGDHLVLEVSDTGCGMPRETQERVFDPFFTTKSAGRGLGLAVVLGIVKALGGAIRLTSEPGKGTTFQVLLPCLEIASGQGLHPESTTTARAAPPGCAVLVVEDEEGLRQGVTKMLRRNGFEVLEAADGTSAIELLRENGSAIDLLLLDMTIPGASSANVVAEATQARPDIKVILTSAYSQQMIAGAVSAPQIYGFIRKPFQMANLVETLRDALVRGQASTMLPG
jgi:PAS domain S-box-containing protein